MPKKETFCSSPWLHMKMGHTGRFYPCRWMNTEGHKFHSDPSKYHIRHMSLEDYANSDVMRNIRLALLDDQAVTGCEACIYQDKIGKTSGRSKQLFRSGIEVGNVAGSMPTSKHIQIFERSKGSGISDPLPIDLQINIGTTCNSSCIMCNPWSSSKLAGEFKILNSSNPNMFSTDGPDEIWSNDDALVDRFVESIRQNPNIEYLHLLGGETLLIKAFYRICDALIEADLAKNIILGTTTNGTIWDSRLLSIIPEFKAFHLGLSIESVNPLNDYIRYPSKVSEVLSTFQRFLCLRSYMPNLHLTLRITPNMFSIYYLDEVIQFMIDNNIAAESCNILERPSMLRIENMPIALRAETLHKLMTVAMKNGIERTDRVLDTRNPANTRKVISNVLFDYADFIATMRPSNDVEQQRIDLVEFLWAFESIHHNCILDYAPEFTDFLRMYGYNK